MFRVARDLPRFEAYPNFTDSPRAYVHACAIALGESYDRWQHLRLREYTRVYVRSLARSLAPPLACVRVYFFGCVLRDSVRGRR